VAVAVAVALIMVAQTMVDQLDQLTLVGLVGLEVVQYLEVAVADLVVVEEDLGEDLVYNGILLHNI
jgi:hypothetical protein